MSTVCEPHRRHDGAVHGPQLLRPGDNCWRVDRAAHFSCIQDAADYFRLVRQAILQARDTVFMVGWDIQSNLDLVPQRDQVSPGGGAHDDDAPTCLDALLGWVVRRRPRLRCYILIWDYAALYTLERDPFTRWRLGWRLPRQVRFGFDDHHPIGGSHHQKIVVVDDELAFCGGIDLTGHRWDTAAHRVEEPARINAAGSPYGPYHEIQAMMDGPVAASLAALVRERWHVLGETTRARGSNAPRGLWPAEIEADLTDVDVAIARTMPPSEREPGIRECERLFLDSIAAAERSIYIESQYFTNDKIGRALGERLQEPDGPEVLAVVPEECHGWLEQKTMGALRDEALRHLIAADRHHRLRVVYPAASRAAHVSTFVHSKVMIVDDRLVRIGSANFSRRSMGVDSECDVAAAAASGEAGTEKASTEGADAARRHRAGVLRIRDRLLGEHLGMPPDAVAAEVARLGSLRALVDARTNADRTLLPVELHEPVEPPPEILKAAADPDEPVGVTAGLTDLIPPLDARADRGSIRLWLPVLASAAACLAAARLLIVADSVGSTVGHVVGNVAGQGVLDALRTPGSWSIWTAVAAVLLAHVVLIPLELIAVLAGVLMGGVSGALAVLAGGWTAAAIGYMIGRVMGPSRVASWTSRRVYRSARQLGARGTIGVALLRTTTMASASSVHLICGAARMPFGAYVAGSILGLTPVIVILSGVGGLLRFALLEPGWANGLLAAAAALVTGALAYGVRSLLLLRQFSPSVRRHRERAEFG